MVSRAIALAVGVVELPDRPLVDALVDGLATRRALLMLDNCEHVIDGAASITTALLEGCPHLRIIATSRRPLGVTDEVTYPVPGLAVPSATDSRSVAATDIDAVRLFAERAAAATPEFRLSEANVELVAHVTRRLDGIPLAIELAAARLNVMSLPQLVARLDDKLAVLAATDARSAPRHWTLRAAVEWSHDLLDENERQLFARLAVFAGPFTEALAAAVCDDRGSLRRLTEQSLVATVDAGDGDRWYRMLEALRDYAGEQLRSRGEEELLRARHAQAFVELAERATENLYGPNCGAWFDRFERHHDDFRAGLEWAIGTSDADLGLRLAAALSRFWNMRYHVREGHEWLVRLLALPGSTPPTRLWGLVAYADLAYWDDDLDDAADAAAEGLGIAAMLGDERAAVRLVTTLAEVRRDVGDLSEAKPLAEAAARRSQAIHDLLGQADVERVLATIAKERGALGEVEQHARELHRLAIAAGSIDRVAVALGISGGVARAGGDLNRAVKLYEQCLQAFRDIGDLWGVARVTNRLGMVAIDRGDERGYEYGRQALQVFETLGSREGAAESLLVMADAALAQGEIDHAGALAEGALDRSRQGGWTANIGWALQTAGAAALARGDTDRAAEVLEEAVDRYRAGEGRDAARSLCLLGLTRVRQARTDEARELLAEALALSHDAGDRRSVARCLLGLAEAALASGEGEAAARYVSAAGFTVDDAGLGLSPPDERELDRARGHIVRPCEHRASPGCVR